MMTNQVFTISDTWKGAPASFKAKIKWTVSRERNTYGYNICTLYVNGKKAAQCNGGGYDMVGTVLGEIITQRFQERLNVLEGHYIYNVDEKGNFFSVGKDPLKNYENYGLTSYHYYDGQRRSSIDGACGVSSVKAIADKVGVKIENVV